MNKNKFMKILSDNLSPLSKEERENALRYYEEFFEECESEEKALEELGDPYIIAQQILSEAELLRHISLTKTHIRTIPIQKNQALT